IQTTFGPIKVGNVYDTLEDGITAVNQAQEALGHKWILGQSFKDKNGALKKRMLRCNCYRNPTESHLMDIDPSDHRQGKSGRTGCLAHVNLCRVPGPLSKWHITTIDATHNHRRSIPEGGTAQRPPTNTHRIVVGRFSDGFTRKQVEQILKSDFPDNSLETRQISNMRNRARREAHDAIEALGGDIESI
ncbi:hypothetical protein DFH09DRAFT_876980, partial [Mycena vulgaris]